MTPPAHVLFPAVVLSLAMTMSCGGIVVDERAHDAAIDTTPAPSPSPSPTTPPPSVTDAAPVPYDATPIPPDPPPPPPPPPPDGGPGATCSTMKASGPPTGSCGAEIACAAGASMAYAQDLLSCLVDKCETELGRGKWCGTIMLGLDPSGCTNDYMESPTAGGCVKYQGMYRSWKCAAGTKIVVTRPCGG